MFEFPVLFSIFLYFLFSLVCSSGKPARLELDYETLMESQTQSRMRISNQHQPPPPAASHINNFTPRDGCPACLFIHTAKLQSTSVVQQFADANLCNRIQFWNVTSPANVAVISGGVLAPDPS